MMMWYGGVGSGWCGAIVNVVAMVLLWSAVFTTIVVAVGFAVRPRREPPAPMGTGSGETPTTVTARIARTAMDNDEFYRRLM